MKYFILAGGHGKRALPLSAVQPKPLFPLGGKPLLGRWLQQLEEKGITRGFINLHHKKELMRRFLAPYQGITVIEERELTGNRVLRDILHRCDDQWFMVINADVWMDIPVPAMIEKTSTSAVAGILLATRMTGLRYRYLRLQDDYFLRRRKTGFTDGWMYTGVALLHRSAIETIHDDNMFDSFERNSTCLRVMPSDGLWLDLGEPGLYYEANRRFAVNHPDTNVTGDGDGFACLSRRVHVDPGVELQGAVIWENTRLKGKCRLERVIVTGDLTLKDFQASNRIITAQGEFPLESRAPME